MDSTATTAAALPAENTAKRGKYLSVTSIGLMTAAAVVTSLRGLPLLAKEEMTMFVYLAFTVVFYLIPASLISAELGGAFADRRGGIYTWVAEAFGTRWGFLAIWLQWIQNVVWYPVALTFGAAALRIRSAGRIWRRTVSTSGSSASSRTGFPRGSCCKALKFSRGSPTGPS
jgi:amino acid transporter